MEEPLLAIIHWYEPPERFRLQQYMQRFGRLLPLTAKQEFPTKKINFVAMLLEPCALQSVGWALERAVEKLTNSNLTTVKSPPPPMT
ncbi:unnamed protein product [Penicillium pancosmium]